MKQNEQGNKNWRWNGSVWDFMATIQWALVCHELGVQQRPNLAKVITSPERVAAEAEKLGLTEEAIAEEMIWIGKFVLDLADYTKEVMGEQLLCCTGKEIALPHPELSDTESE